MKLGHIFDPNHIRLPDVLAATTGLPPTPASVAAPALDYPMALNDQYGDCEIAEVIHLAQVDCSITGEAWAYPGDDAVKTTYLGLTGGQDTGLMTTQVLGVALSPGLFGHRWGAYGRVDQATPAAMQTAVFAFGGAFCAVNLPTIAMDQFNNVSPWDLTGTSQDDQIDGGHAVPIVGYDAEYFYCVTWGRLQPLTYRWWARYAQEAYAVVTNAFEARGGDGRGVNINALITAA